MEDRDRGGANARLELLSPELIRHAVIVAVYLHVVVDIDGDFFPLGELVTVSRQRGQRRPVDGVEQMLPGDLELLQGALVKYNQLFRDRLVEFCQREETMVSQYRQYPPFDDQYGRFHLGLVFGFAGPGRNDGGPIVPGQVQVGGIDVGFVAARVGDSAFQVVRDQDLGNPAEKLKSADVGFDPVGQRLGGGCFGIAVIAGAQRGDENLGFKVHLAGFLGCRWEPSARRNR